MSSTSRFHVNGTGLTSSKNLRDLVEVGCAPSAPLVKEVIEVSCVGIGFVKVGSMNAARAREVEVGELGLRESTEVAGDTPLLRLR